MSILLKDPIPYGIGSFFNCVIFSPISVIHARNGEDAREGLYLPFRAILAFQCVVLRENS